ncbi:MAG: hypothetical protein JOZ32_06715 [Bryobacterales bacterium]|nr:hypothetical protein [Bryobacterales bacterium]
MTDIQLYFAVGIPTFAVLIGILMNVVHHSSVNARFNSVDARFNSLKTRFDTLLDKVIDLDNRVTRIEAKLDR